MDVSSQIGIPEVVSQVEVIGEVSSSMALHWELPKRRKVCAIFSEMEFWPVYIVDLETDEPPRSDPCVDEFTNLDHPCRHGFVDRVPNVMLTNFDYPCFFGIGQSVYVFEGMIGMMKGKLELDDEAISLLRMDSMMSIYRFEPSDFLEMSDCRIDKSMLQVIGAMQGPKIAPEAIKYGPYILVFSTEIAYVSSSDPLHGAVDFELYMPGRPTTRRLPSLRVNRRRGHLGSGCSYYLLHPTSKRERLTPTWLDHDQDGWRMVPKCPCVTDDYDCVDDYVESCCGSSFNIHRFSLINGNTFVVEADICGLSFCLNLESSEDWQIYNGSSLPHSDHNFVTKNGLVLHPSGASLFSDESNGHRVEFPLSSRVSRSNVRNCFMELVEGTKFAFVVQVGYDYALRPHWTLDMLRLDESKFSSCLEMEKEREREREKEKLKLREKGVLFTRKEDDEFAKRMKTYKFRCQHSNPDYLPVCLFPF